MIRIVPLGNVSGEVLAHLQQELSRALEREVTIGPPLPLPATALDVAPRQYGGNALLEELARHDHGAAERVVGVVDADLYAPGLNFIFGQAQKPGRFAVVGLARLRESFRGRREDPVRLRERLVKVTIHELGHTFDFAHCLTPGCVMNFANALGDIDRQSSRYCPDHGRAY